MATITLSSLVISTFTKQLDTLLHILKKAESHAASQDIDPNAEYLPARLIDDMRPLSFQIQNLTRHVRVVVGRLAGVDTGEFDNTETTFADYYERIKKAREIVQGVDGELIDARAEAIVKQPFGTTISIDVTAKESVFGHGLPNAYFHLNQAYAILRTKGVPVGKLDYIQEFYAPIVIPA
ncbi:hypothetical protein OQA88_803 [Cercophora sp. LCS_1]